MTAVRRGLALLLIGGLASSCAGRETRVVAQPPLRPVPPVTAPSPPAEATPRPPAGAPPAPVAQAPAPPAAPPGAAAPAAPATRPPTTTPGRGRQIVLNFDNADIEAVIQAASEIAGFNYTIGPGVAGKKVTVQTSGRIPEDEVFNVLLAVLEVHGVTAIRSGNLYKIVPIATAREKPLPTIIGGQADATRRDDEVITQIVPITHVPADRVAAAIRPFVQGGNIVVHGNLLIVTDTAGNIGRLLQIVTVLDVESALDDLRIVLVSYADAVEVAKILNDFFTGRRVRTPAPTVTPVPTRPGVPTAPGIPTTADAGDRPPLIIADKRTNSLIISARRADLETVTQLLSQLDVDTQANKRVFVYYVENVKAKDLAATLTEIFGRPSKEAEAVARREVPPGAPPGPTVGPGATLGIPSPVAPPAPGAAGGDVEPGVVEGQVKVVADEPNNALVITTFPRNWPLIEDTIRKLDRTPKQVLIEVLVAEITLDDTNQLGIEWALRTQQPIKVGGQTFNIGTFTGVDVGPAAPGLAPPGLPPLPIAAPATAGLTFFIFETDRFLGLLNLYAQYGKIDVLSSPHILTSENKKAVINVSQSVAIPTQQVTQLPTPGQAQPPTPQQPISTSPILQNIEFRDAGIVLTVTPRISEKRVVALDVKQTVNEVGPVINNVSSFLKREAETSVVLYDNQTLVLGGLIQTRRSTTQTGIPGLSRIPFLGFLFGSTRDDFRRVELLLLITPRVIGDPGEARQLYEQVRAQRPELQRGLRTHPSILRPDTGETIVPVEPRPRTPAPADPSSGGPSGER